MRIIYIVLAAIILCGCTVNLDTDKLVIDENGRTGKVVECGADDIYTIEYDHGQFDCNCQDDPHTIKEKHKRSDLAFISGSRNKNLPKNRIDFDDIFKKDKE